MKRKPRPVDEPILSRPMLLWLAVIGFVIGLGTLGVIWGADDSEGTAVARTMGLTTFAIANVFYSFTTRDERRSIFSLETLEDHRFLSMTGLSVAAIVFGTELRVFQRILDTVSLSLNEWLICIAVALLVIAVSETRKFFLRRREKDEPAVPVQSSPATVDQPVGVM